MIVSNLENAAKYKNIDGKIAACVDYAAQLNADTPCGRYEVSEDVSAVEYDKEKDIAMWKGNISLIPLRAGDFALFFPNEPHAPSLHKTSGTVKKAVFKIKY